MVDDRRAMFRDVMSRLDPTIDPECAVKDNLYVRPPNGIARRLSARFDIDPSSTHLVVGGIGSGKTTELIQAARLLEIPVEEIQNFNKMFLLFLDMGKVGFIKTQLGRQLGRAPRLPRPTHSTHPKSDD